MFTPSNIATPEEIFKACQEAQTALEAHYNADNANACTERLQLLEGHMAITGKMLADAKHHLRMRTERSIDDLYDKKAKLSPSIFNKYIEANTRDYGYLADWCNRLNASCVHSIEATRTIISKLKEEMRIANYGHN